MTELTASEIASGLEKYRENLPFDDHEEHLLISGIRTQDYVTAQQLERIIDWKLANQGGRAPKNIERLHSIPEQAIEYVTRAAFLVGDPKTQLKILNGIPGVGYATATVILTFHDPEDYAVGDRIINEVVLGEAVEVRPTNYLRLLEALNGMRPSGFTLRQIEKSLYGRSYNG